MFFFFQAEDGIRDVAVTGVQTCALPIYAPVSLFLCAVILSAWFGGIRPGLLATALSAPAFYYYFLPPIYSLGAKPRSEEHTSELQSRLHLVCRLLLEKKKLPSFLVPQPSTRRRS